MKRVLIFQDTEHLENTRDLLETVNQMYPDGKFLSTVVTIGEEKKALEGYFHTIIQVAQGPMGAHDPRVLCEVLRKLHSAYHFHSILIPATALGRMVAPRLAKALGTGLVADVTEIMSVNGSGFELVRPAYSGRIMAGIVTQGNGPVMLSVRPGVFSYVGEANLDTTCIDYTEPVEICFSMKRLNSRPKEISYDIRKSEVLVSGGGGIGKNLGVLDQLAQALNGQVSASRKIVDKGIAPRSIQVGQSGKTVSPRLYIALGIHGAIQHVEGLKNVDFIIAVNINKDAPLCSLADIVVEGDSIEFIGKITEKIHEYRSKNKNQGELK